MRTTVTIDRAGRIVIPKDVREKLHLTPGTVLTLERQGEELTLAPASHEARLEIVNGTPLIFAASSGEPPVLTTEMANEILAQGRLERERRVLGLSGDEDAG